MREFRCTSCRKITFSWRVPSPCSFCGGQFHYEYDDEEIHVSSAIVSQPINDLQERVKSAVLQLKTKIKSSAKIGR